MSREENFHPRAAAFPLGQESEAGFPSALCPDVKLRSCMVGGDTSLLGSKQETTNPSGHRTPAILPPVKRIEESPLAAVSESC